LIRPGELFASVRLLRGTIGFYFIQKFLMTKTFSIVVPLFNEEENIVPLVETVFAVVGSDPNFAEIVLVDDGSGDRTAALAVELARCEERIRLVRHQKNQGLGAAIRSGIDAATGDFVLYTDADLPFDFKLIPQLFAVAGENRIVSGSRLNRGEGGRRWILTKGYNLLVRQLFGLRMRDANFACKIFPKRFLNKAKFTASGSFIDVEMLLEARRCGLEIYEQPLEYHPRTRGLSTLSRPRVILFIMREMLAYAYESKIARRQWTTLPTALNLSESE
jgi:glycosyltransferase involved in cell wall biosynthesis